MTTDNQSSIQVLADHAGRILAAVKLREQSAPDEGSVTLATPREDAIVHELKIPAGPDGDKIFASIHRHYVRTDSGQPHLALISGDH
jgi:hypothetical protein